MVVYDWKGSRKPDKSPPTIRYPEEFWKWIIYLLPNQEQVIITICNIINHLMEIFAWEGIPKWIRAGYDRLFTSNKFKQFCDNNNVELPHISLYLPQANGKSMMKNMSKSILKPFQICRILKWFTKVYHNI